MLTFKVLCSIIALVGGFSEKVCFHWQNTIGTDGFFTGIYSSYSSSFIQIGFLTMNSLLLNKVIKYLGLFICINGMLSMNFLMYSKTWLLGKCFSTFVTRIGLLSCMSFLMSKEMRLLEERFATFSTSVRPLSCMNSLMCNKHRWVAEDFATYCTVVRFFSFKKFRVFIKG